MADGTKPTTHTMRAIVELRRRILNGAYAGGTRLFEVSLGEELAISRTPIRAALSRLAEEGLLERFRGGGFVVRSFAYEDVLDTIELRGVLEGTAARLAAERGVPPAKMTAMAEILRALDGAFGTGGEVDFEAYSEHNSRFHDALASLAGSATVARELARLKSLPFASPSAFLTTGVAAYRHSLTTAQAEHHAIVVAIGAREGTRAEALAREHARTAREDMKRILSGDQSFADAMPALALVAADGTR